MDNLSLSNHFNNLINIIQHRITNDTINETAYDKWMNFAKKIFL